MRQEGIWQTRQLHPHLNPMAHRAHPFVLDVRPVRHVPGRFVYSVGQMGETKAHSLHTYATFEEARRAGQAELQARIAAWERENAQACP